jgi:GNAT superfamily N-acetyltransferase
MPKVELATKAVSDGDFEFCWTVYSQSVKDILQAAIPLGWKHLYLRESHRRKGIGTILIDFVKSRAKQGGKRLVVNVLKGTPAVTFAEKVGFKPTGESRITVEMQHDC